MPIDGQKSLAYQTILRFLPLLSAGAIVLGLVIGIFSAVLEQRKATTELVTRTTAFFYQLERARMRDIHSKLAVDIQRIVGADAIALYGPDCGLLAVSPGNYISALRTCDSARSELREAVIFPVDDVSNQVSHILVYKAFPIWESLVVAFLYLLAFGALVSIAALLTVRFFANNILANAIASLLRSIESKEDISGVSKELAPVAALLAEFKSEILLQEGEKAELSRVKAIAQMTQMMAHDVRKPFSSVKMVLGAMAKVKSFPEVKAMTALAIPEINRSIETVNGLILDVMEIGSKSEPITESVDVCDLVDRALRDTFRVYLDSNVRIDYALNHSSQLSVDKNKVLRVFSNILGNGLQAMGFRGVISVSTRDLPGDHPYIEFTLANDGPHISAESLPKLFDAFFTSGKKGGTGLGLAIAHKIVTAHGGNIVCKSEPGKGVAFVFTLPASTEKPVTSSCKLATNSAAYIKAAMAAQAFEGDSSPEIDESNLAESFAADAAILGRKLVVLVADDERLYRDGLIEKLQRHSKVHEHLIIAMATNPYEAIEVKNSDLAVLDVDLGCQEMNGFDVVSQLRKKGNRGIICTHSNRILASDHKTAIDHGADAFLPKPMSTVHLLKLLCQAIARAKELSGVKDNVTQSVAVDPSAAGGSLKFAFVDDSKIIRMGWKRAWKNGILVEFSSPEAFWKEAEENPSLIDSLACVITDFDFGHASKENGGTFANQLRTRTSLPVFLASDGEFSISDFNGDIDAIIGKQPISETALSSAIERAKLEKK